MLHSAPLGSDNGSLHAHLGPGRTILAPDLIGYGGTEDRCCRPFSIGRGAAVASALTSRGHARFMLLAAPMEAASHCGRTTPRPPLAHPDRASAL